MKQPVFICKIVDNSVVGVMFSESNAQEQVKLLNNDCGEERYRVITDPSKVVWKE